MAILTIRGHTIEFKLTFKRTPRLMADNGAQARLVPKLIECDIEIDEALDETF